MNRAVFLDRDGVINQIVYFPELGLLDSPLNPKQFKLLPGVSKAIRHFNDLGFKVIIVSNQPAIGKGKMTEEMFERVRLKMRRELEIRGAYIDAEYYCLHAYIDAEYYCLHHPNAKIKKYRVNCNCRKPKPGLLLKAAKDFELNLHESYMIGDSLTDVVAGKTVGCRSFLIGRLKCDLCKLMDDFGVKPDLIVSSLLHASEIIEKEVEVKWRYSLTQRV